MASSFQTRVHIEPPSYVKEKIIMALPNGFDKPFEYNKQALAFLRRHSWIYKEANTRFLSSNILDQMPHEFQEYFQNADNNQLNQFPLVHEDLQVNNHPQINRFRQELATLIPAEAFLEPPPSICDLKLKMTTFKKMNKKKQHEIQRLATAVHQHLMQEPNARYCLIDFGCGLGYLSECLYRLNANFIVLGLESDLYRVAAAQKRLHDFMPQAEGAVHYRQELITESSSQFISTSVQELCQANYNETTNTATLTSQEQEQQLFKMAIIGLHACADLTITSMKLFLEMPQVRHLIIMPCCYHKLQMCATTLKFHNFPLSQSLKDAVHSMPETDSIRNYVAYLNRPFLRLACQQTLKRWCKSSDEQHATHGREMYLRAVVEALKQETEIVVKRKETIDLCLSKRIQFETFIRLYELKSQVNDSNIVWDERHKRQFDEILEKYPWGEKLAEGLTCLQTSMQKLCENLVLYDRLCYMREVATDLKLNINVRYEKLMDEEVSPRCYVLIAEKI